MGPMCATISIYQLLQGLFPEVTAFAVTVFPEVTAADSMILSRAQQGQYLAREGMKDHYAIASHIYRKGSSCSLLGRMLKAPSCSVLSQLLAWSVTSLGWRSPEVPSSLGSSLTYPRPVPEAWGQ